MKLKKWMRNHRFSKIIIRYGMSLLFVTVYLLCFEPKRVYAEDLAFTFFYNNSCASCHEDEDIYDLFNRCFSSEEKQQMDYEVLVYNVFLQSGEELFLQYCDKHEQVKSEQEFPILVVGDTWVNGYENIEAYLKNDFKLRNGSDLWTDNVSEEESHGDSQQKTADNPSTVTEFLNQEKEKNEECTSPFFLLFTTYNCEDCKKVKAFLDQYQKDNQEIKIEEYNIGEDSNVEILRSLYACYGVEEKQQQVPVLFLGDRVLHGEYEISSELKKLDLSEGYDFQHFCAYVYENASTASTEKVNYATLAAAGFLAGFNPCGISMLLMLLSILMTSKAKVLKNGLLYILAKLATYLGIGIAAYIAASAAFSTGLEKMSFIFTAIMAALLLLLSLLNFVDFFYARKQQYGKIRLQLPVSLRKYNHKLIQRIAGASDRTIPFVALGLGIAISFGEFFCTGQIYMASILYMLRTQTESMLSVYLMFVVYVSAMMIPTLVVVLIVHKTHQAQRVSEFMLRRMDLIKLLNAVLFLGFFVYLMVTI